MLFSDFEDVVTVLRGWLEFRRTANHVGAPVEEQLEPQSTNSDSELFDYSVGDVERFIKNLPTDLSDLTVRLKPCPLHCSLC